MSRSNYRELAVWQKSRRLVAEVYRITRAFPRDELFGLTTQMRRAAVSTPCNIAEGIGRHSRKETVHFLMIARGSTLEFETQVTLAADLEFASDEAAEELSESAVEIARMLNGLIAYFSDQ